ncbi:hypothetical protein EGT74_25760 [Chitinophaga lutea]|uniref:Lysozyme family protein n=1 Tax=Chitinophaga lutea TaxID=2488634 RepID=A0A3N4PAW4_9BACT|nr:hypothetical protein [Chitinophaga lutea]RPE05773.1 hypothetical protein EGT74_25760 [Chitinophaga lutea]
MQTHTGATVQPKDKPKRKPKGKTRTKPGGPAPRPGPTNAEYIQLFDTCELKKEKLGEIDKVIDDKILANRARYETVVATLQGRQLFGLSRTPALGGISFFQPRDFYSPQPQVQQPSGFFFQDLFNRSPNTNVFDFRNPFNIGFRTNPDFFNAGSGRVPWAMIAVIHYLECSSDFSKHLHNGDPLTGYTVKHPPNRPKNAGKPPFTWEVSAVDAMRLKQFDKKQNWTLPEVLYTLEAYNGFGYHKNKKGNTPYLWSYSNHYTKGKYVRDFKYDSNAVSAQIGAAVLLKRMEQRGLIYLPRF